MKRYDWEARAAHFFAAELDEIKARLPDSFPYEVVGIAVGHKETGEAAFFVHIPTDNDILAADYLQDVMCDATAAYEDVLGWDE